MAGGIFVINEANELLPLTETAYNSEDLLQSLLEDYPDLLAGDQIDSEAPRQWLLVAREMGVPGEDHGGDRWSLDHLFVDQDAVPTLVEVKRASDTRIRREVVGQMFDYAANANRYWPEGRIREEFDRTCRAKNVDPGEQIEGFINSDDDAESFWARVDSNLRDGRLRLLFVADAIPPELQRVIEFLNQRMDDIEVLGIAIKQFTGGNLKTMVPRVIGQTEQARERKKDAWHKRPRWTEERFFSTLTDRVNNQALQAARSIYEWACQHYDRVYFGRGKVDGSCLAVVTLDGRENYVFNVYTTGRLYVTLNYLKSYPPFSDEVLRKELLSRLNRVPGVDIDEDNIGGMPTVRLEDLAVQGGGDRLLSVFAWAAKTIRASAEA